MRHHYHRYNGLRGLGADGDVAAPKKLDLFWPIAILGVLGAVLLTIKFTKTPSGKLVAGYATRKLANGRYMVLDVMGNDIKEVSDGEVFTIPDEGDTKFKIRSDGIASPV